MEGKLQLVPDTSVKNRYYVCGIHISPVYQVRIDKHQDSLDNSGNTRVSMFFEMLSPYLQKNKSTYALRHYYLNIENFVMVKSGITDVELTNVISKKLDLINSAGYACQIERTYKENSAPDAEWAASLEKTIDHIKEIYGYTPLGMACGVAYSKIYKWVSLSSSETDICFEPNLPAEDFATLEYSEKLQNAVKVIQATTT